ncbi:MAG TPA: GDP-mannose 4,6-dehydratase [Gaiellaceae bacterium]|nr:GDP-mannose 4,6-dehydratase [Gaiellaceae bacterium]
MHWLVTGGAGFIGSHLSERLIAGGHRVTVIDDLSTGSASNLTAIRDHKSLRFHADTVMNLPLIRELVDEADIVVHLAAAVGVRLIVESPVRTIETNIGATEVLLEAVAMKKKRVLVASTSEVYGKSTRFPFNEDDDLVLGASTMGRWSYAASKLIDEFLTLAYHKEKKVPATVVRLFNTVGPRQTGRYGMVIPSFVRQALDGKPITVFGDGSQQRCFGHVFDVIGALEKLCLSDAAVGRVFNVGATDEITILGLAEKVKAMTGSTSTIELVPYDKAYEAGFEDMMRRIPDIGRVKECVGYQPTRNLDQILKDVIAFERERRT